MDDLLAFLRSLDEDAMPQDHVAKLLALLWNQGLAMILTSQDEERGKELQGMARALAPYARKYRLYFQEIFNSTPIT